jgi:hypothetical protein
MAKEPWRPGTPDEDLPQDPGVPGGAPPPEEDEPGSLEHPESPEDPRGIDAPGSPHVPPPQN